MKTFHKTFLALIAIEAIITAFMWNTFGTSGACNKPSFIHPFGGTFEGVCIQILLYIHPAKQFYIATDILILTILVYLAVILKEKFSKK